MPWHYFLDPVLRGPTIGSMMMCLGASLVGVIVFLRKQSLLGESLSHAAYPGVIFGVIIAGLLKIDDSQESIVVILVMTLAAITALLGLFSIQYLEKKAKIKSDSALCFVLSGFFGIGLMFASQVQFSFTSLYRLAQSYLYGQAATMTDQHIWIYGTFAMIIMLLFASFYKEIKALTFNRDYAESLGIQVKPIETIIFVLIVLAVVIGVRSVGVVLMSAMLISPAVAARQFTNRLSRMLMISGFFGLLTGFLGNYLSIEGSNYFSTQNLENSRFALPTGPMIVLVSSFICVLSLLLAPKRGLLIRILRSQRFLFRSSTENVLKAIWRKGNINSISINELRRYQDASYLYLFLVLFYLRKQNLIKKIAANVYQLTENGKVKAAHIVRLHRLWEVYLVDYLGVGKEKVHMNAEEMEHVITPEIEKELTLLLKDPKVDPHHQKIPPQDAVS